MLDTSIRRRVYLDNCCLSRIFDDLTYDRIRRERSAVFQIINHIQSDKLIWICSSWCMTEVNNNPNQQSKEIIHTIIMDYVSETITVTQKEQLRADKIKMLGFRSEDSLHIACAESGGADVLLTTDRKMINKYRRVNRYVGVPIENPIAWLNGVRI